MRGSGTAHDVAPQGVGWRGIALLAVAVLGTLAMYGVGVLLPYYVNDLRAQPQRVAKALALVAVMAASVGALAFLLTATGEALTTWRLD